MEKTSIEGSAGGCQTCFIADASKGKRGRMISMYLDKTYMEVLRCTGEWQRLGKKIPFVDHLSVSPSSPQKCSTLTIEFSKNCLESIDDRLRVQCETPRLWSVQLISLYLDFTEDFFFSKSELREPRQCLFFLSPSTPSQTNNSKTKNFPLHRAGRQ